MWKSTFSSSSFVIPPLRSLSLSLSSSSTSSSSSFSSSSSSIPTPITILPKNHFPSTLSSSFSTSLSPSVFSSSSFSISSPFAYPLSFSSSPSIPRRFFSTNFVRWPEDDPPSSFSSSPLTYGKPTDKGPTRWLDFDSVIDYFWRWVPHKYHYKQYDWGWSGSLILHGGYIVIFCFISGYPIVQYYRQYYPAVPGSDLRPFVWKGDLVPKAFKPSETHERIYQNNLQKISDYKEKHKDRSLQEYEAMTDNCIEPQLLVPIHSTIEYRMCDKHGKPLLKVDSDREILVQRMADAMEKSGFFKSL